MGAQFTRPESRAWTVDARSSNQTILVPSGAIFGTVASSSVARVMPTRLPTRSAGVLMLMLCGAKMVIESAPFGLQYITALARSVVTEIDAMVTSARPANSVGMRPVDGT